MDSKNAEETEAADALTKAQNDKAEKDSAAENAEKTLENAKKDVTDKTQAVADTTTANNEKAKAAEEEKNTAQAAYDKVGENFLEKYSTIGKTIEEMLQTYLGNLTDGKEKEYFEASIRKAVTVDKLKTAADTVQETNYYRANDNVIGPSNPLKISINKIIYALFSNAYNTKEYKAKSYNNADIHGFWRWPDSTGTSSNLNSKAHKYAENWASTDRALPNRTAADKDTTGSSLFYDEKYDYVNKTGNTTGHYTNMMNKSYTSMGAACDGFLTEELGYNDGTEMTVDEFRTNLDAFAKSAKDALDAAIANVKAVADQNAKELKKAKDELDAAYHAETDAQTAKDTADSEAAKAGETVTAQQSAYDTAAQAAKSAAEVFKDASEQAKEALDVLNGKKKNKDSAQTKADEAKATREEKETDLESKKKSQSEKEQAVTAAQGNVDDTNSKISDLESQKKTDEDTLSAENEKLTTAQTEAATAKDATDKSQKAEEEAQNKADAAKQEADAAVKEQDNKQQTYDEKQKAEEAAKKAIEEKKATLEEKKKALEDAQKKLAEENKEYEAAKEAYDKAAADLKVAQEAYDSSSKDYDQKSKDLKAAQDAYQSASKKAEDAKAKTEDAQAKYDQAAKDAKDAKDDYDRQKGYLDAISDADQALTDAKAVTDSAIEAADGGKQAAKDAHDEADAAAEAFRAADQKKSLAETANKESSRKLAGAVADLQLALQQYDDLLKIIYTKGSAEGLKLGANGDYTVNGKIWFASLLIDGKVVDPSAYTVAQGSTYATVNSNMLDTMSEGEHSYQFIYSAAGGTSQDTDTQKFYIKTAVKETPAQPAVTEPETKVTNETEETSKPANTAHTSEVATGNNSGSKAVNVVYAGTVTSDGAVETGDTNNIGGYGLMSAAALAAGFLAIFEKKRRRAQ